MEHTYCIIIKPAVGLYFTMPRRSIYLFNDCIDDIEGLEAELTMSKNVILRKTRFKVSVRAKKSEILIHNVILCRYVSSPILNYIL